MKPHLKIEFEHEMSQAREKLARNDFDGAFAHLERAHILGQRSTRAHVRSHWAMLVAGYRKADAREMRGQLSRMVAALLFSRIWVPVGNTGRANVSALKSMPIPAELRDLIERT